VQGTYLVLKHAEEGMKDRVKLLQGLGSTVSTVYAQPGICCWQFHSWAWLPEWLPVHGLTSGEGAYTAVSRTRQGAWSNEWSISAQQLFAQIHLPAGSCSVGWNMWPHPV